jgi:hypothetical protein
MAGQRDIFQRQTLSGEEVTVGDLTVRPQSQALVIRWPSGGIVWNRPTAVLVERDGQTQRIPILDVTRLAILAIVGFSIVYVVASIVLSARRRRNRNA